MTINSDKPLTTGQAAKLMRISIQQVNRLVDQGYLKGFRVPGGGHRRIMPADLWRFMRKNGMPEEWIGGS